MIIYSHCNICLESSSPPTHIQTQCTILSLCTVGFFTYSADFHMQNSCCCCLIHQPPPASTNPHLQRFICTSELSGSDVKVVYVNINLESCTVMCSGVALVKVKIIFATGRISTETAVQFDDVMKQRWMVKMFVSLLSSFGCR